MKRAIIAAVMLLGTALAAHSETDVWNDVRKPWRNNAEMDSALQVDVSICDREAGEQRGPVTSKYKKCMLGHHWKFSHAIRAPSSPIVIQNSDTPVDNSNDEIFRLQQQQINTQQMINQQNQSDIQRMNQDQFDQQQQIINNNRLQNP